MLEALSTVDLGALGRALGDAAPVLIAIAAALSVFVLTARLFKARGQRSDQPGLVGRLGAAFVAAFTTNWQLTLLATTAFVLSLASGWTTWDGMRNFTGEPVLSFMITFGIQGLMLIIAWLIGESFAAGLGQRQRGRAEIEDTRSGFWRQMEPVVGMLVGAVFALTLIVLAARGLGLFDELGEMTTGRASLGTIADKGLYLGIALLLVATLLINQKSDIVQPYLQSLRVMARTAVLWVMFLACMATSVFFSFDSLFSSIFPAEERKRSADIRAQRQIAGAVTDIGTLARRRQAEQAEQLFRTQGWTAFETNLAALARASLGAEQEIERYFVERMESHKTAMAAQQERIAAARSGEAGLISRKGMLSDELGRLKADRPALAAELAEKKSELETRNRNIDAKRVEAMAEERGAEGTLKQGRGPVYRQRMGELAQMQDAVRIQEQRVRDAEKRLADADSRVAAIEREIAALDAGIAKQRGEAATASQRIAVAEASKAGDAESPKVDPARVRLTFERAHAEFRQAPSAERLDVLAQQCTQLLGAMAATPATKERVRSIDCDPKPAAEAAAPVFSLNHGLVAFAERCAGGDKLPVTGGTDAMLTFGRKCLQDAGLPSADVADMAARISAIDLNRDDKAHRFVVTWNAFNDGNRLAYLALAIAIAIDGLIFMSGLFGANAVRSPLADLEGRTDLTPDQLEAAIDNMLHHTADPRRTLAALVRAMHPIHSNDGFTAIIEFDDHEPHSDDMRAVLAAASTIGAVRPVDKDRRGTYLVSTGLARYFAVAQRKSWKVKADELDRKELVSIVGVALSPRPEHNADIVLSHLHPISDARGYAAETYLKQVESASELRLVRSVLGAGATIPNAVFRENNTDRYFVSTDFYRTLLGMKAGRFPGWREHEIAERDAIRKAQFQARAEAQAGQQQRLPARPIAAAGSPAHLHAEPVPRLADQSRDVPPRPPATQSSDERQPAAAPPPAPSREAAPPPIPHGTRPDAPQHPAAIPAQRPAEGVARQAARAESQRGRPPRASEVTDPDSSLGDEIRADIIRFAGLHAWSERDIAIARAIGAESEPEQALKRLSARAPRLAKLVGHTIDDNRASLREAYDQLLAHRGQDAMYRQVLETVAVELDELMPILMLTPGGPYQQLLEHQLISSLERQAGDGMLTPADELLLARARAQVEALKALSDHAGDRFSRVVRIIDQYDERGAGSSQATGRADVADASKPPMS